MTVAMLVLEPIFEADLPPEQYVYRPGRYAQQAALDVEELLFHGHREAVEANLADYFGSIPHAELLKSVGRRVVDRRVLHLIKQWRECRVEETDDRGWKTRTTEAKDQRRGIPQCSPISPLLANLYMRRFVLAWKQRGLERSLGSKIETYADDLVILRRKGKPEEALRPWKGPWPGSLSFDSICFRKLGLSAEIILIYRPERQYQSGFQADPSSRHRPV